MIKVTVSEGGSQGPDDGLFYIHNTDEVVGRDGTVIEVTMLRGDQQIVYVMQASAMSEWADQTAAKMEEAQV